ncbi:hypothetical protein CVT24_011756 [Panaeolus cyanescens]|uniref:CBM1 domain-containing protein n=1 Tax=Panaeolus cyanescens TaxID=181874 RepID=A0A409VYQ8_9AGAR|nr:hypothetical protein CVT24_011756 [Panaeolus cyanescens]
MNLILLPSIVLTLLATAVAGQLQSAARWCDSITGLCFARYYLPSLDVGFGYVFPPLPPAGQQPSNEFIGFFTAPVTTGWIGNSLGGGMRSNPLIVAWTDNSTPRVSARYGREYLPPQPLVGPVITVLGSSGANATHQRIFYRCQNCTTWTGGSGGINLTGTSTFGYALHGALKPETPNDINSSIFQHTASGQHTVDVGNWHVANYEEILQQLRNAPPINGGPTPTSTVTPPISTASSCPGAPNPSYSMVPASGWRVMPVLGRLRSPRGLTLDSRGNLIVLQRGIGVTGHTLDVDGCVTSSKTIIADSSLNHAVEFSVDGTKIFASSSDIAWSWTYDAASMTASDRRTLITGMHNVGHTTRTLLVSKKYPNLLMASVGSDGNIDLPSFHPASGRAQIRVFDQNTLPSNGVPYTQGRVLGYGLRNDVGMAEDAAGIVHSVENSMDNAYRTINGVRTDVHNDNPGEPVWRLGTPNTPSNLFGGYPYCFLVWEPSNFRDKTFQPGDWFVQAPNSTLTDSWCEANAVKPKAMLPPHTAPLDMKFGVGDDAVNLYVSLHGSWNRSPPQGYKVVIIPGRLSPSGEWSPQNPLSQARTAILDILRNRDETQCQSGCFRPVGLVWSASGQNLYVASDTSGEVFLLKRNVAGPIISTSISSGGPSSTSTVPTTTSGAPQPTQTVWGQCGGNNYTGPKLCATGSTCRYQNDWYSQCVPS